MIELIKDTWSDPMGKFFIAVVMVGVGYIIYDAYQWPYYARKHGCVETGETREKSTTICSQIGKTLICSPHEYIETLWTCRGGERNWR